MGDEKKLRSEEVPRAFTEWLLTMGYPAESEPLIDKVTEMCRGNGHMVWRSLMEHVEARKVIRDKRMQVFCDDIHLYEKKKCLNEFDTNNPVPEPLLLWRQQTKLRGEVAEAEDRVVRAKQNLNYVKDKISAKLTERNLSRRRAEDVQRRAMFLRRVAEDLRAWKAELEESRAIAQSLSPVTDDRYIQNKLDRCISSRRHGPQSSASMSSSVSQLSMMSAISSSTLIDDNSYEEQLSSLMKCSGAALCSALYERRAALIAALPITATKKADQSRNRVTARSVLATTEALHCSLGMETTKNRILLKQAQNRLLDAISELNEYLTGESCELLVVQCEKARVEARVRALRKLLDELVTRKGAFEICKEQADHGAVVRTIAVVDKAIKSKIEELKKVNTALIITERKIQNLQECLTTVFNGFHNGLTPNDNYSYNGLKLGMPQESIATLREFYEAWRKRRANRMELSMNLDISGRSECDAIDINNPRLIDELRIYLEKFNLEKNRKLVLESGEKIWIFETLQSTLERLHSRWHSEDIIYASVSPCDSFTSNLQRIVIDVRCKATLEAMKRAFRLAERPQDIDITPQIEEEEQIIDKIKKRLKDNLILLQKTNTTLELSVYNLKFWSDNKLRNYISQRITVRGLTYKQYEKFYLENYDSIS